MNRKKTAFSSGADSNHSETLAESPASILSGVGSTTPDDFSLTSKSSNSVPTASRIRSSLLPKCQRMPVLAGAIRQLVEREAQRPLFGDGLLAFF